MRGHIGTGKATASAGNQLLGALKRHAQNFAHITHRNTARSEVPRQFPRLQRCRSCMTIGNLTVRDNPLSPGSDVDAVNGD